MNSDQNFKASAVNEIDLFELVRGLWKEKFLIVGSVLLFVCIAVLYLLFTTKFYEVKSVLKPATLMDLEDVNSSGVYKLTPEDALKKVGASLESYDTRLGFFKANSQLFAPLQTSERTLEQEFREFNVEQVEILKPDPKKSNQLSDFIAIKIKYPEDLDGVAITNGLVAYAIDVERKRTAADIRAVIENRLSVVHRKIEAARASYQTDKAVKIAELEEEIQLQRAELEDELKTLRENLKEARANRILQLEESIRIAKSAGIMKPSSALAQDRSTDTSNVGMPLHFMGANVLQAELDALKSRTDDEFSEPRIAEITRELKMLDKSRKIEILKNRKDDDLFLSELAALKAEEASLKSLNLNLEALMLVRIDQPAEEPLEPASPKKLIVLAIGVVLGGALGLFVAFGRIFFRKSALGREPNVAR